MDERSVYTAWKCMYENNDVNSLCIQVKELLDIRDTQ